MIESVNNDQGVRLPDSTVKDKVQSAVVNFEQSVVITISAESLFIPFA